MDSIADILGKYTPQEPDEIGAVKRYISDEFGADSTVGLHGETLVITVRSASLANALRLRIISLQKAANTKRKIMFRIG
ncbi:MAG TPA: hypothetical protein VL737_00195 [Candidatus Pristimantibacillus sp.]|jgi:hypothetical protein|nr:hypothetical protein [Candidatus Pristimantibacillus sp.]